MYFFWYIIDIIKAIEPNLEKILTVRFYRSVPGNQPVREWLLSLDDKDRFIIGRDIQRCEFEWPVGMPYCRSLSNGLWEVRSRLTNGRISRVVFMIHEKNLVLLHGFIKKTQKTPKQDLDLAKARMKEVENG